MTSGMFFTRENIFKGVGSVSNTWVGFAAEGKEH